MDTHHINTEYGVCGVAGVGALPMRLNVPFLHLSPLMNVFDLDSSEEDGDDENVIIQKEASKMLTVKDLCWTQCLSMSLNEVAAIFQNSDLC